MPHDNKRKAFTTMTYQSTKTYGHEIGLSCAFRQWKAKSHCQFIHGYALSFKFIFETKELDKHNWVVDFGGLKQLKETLKAIFDHKMIIARDDPLRVEFKLLQDLGGLQGIVMDNVGCEAFARVAFEEASRLIAHNGIKVVSCECAEHGANSAIYIGEY